MGFTAQERNVMEKNGAKFVNQSTYQQGSTTIRREGNDTYINNQKMVHVSLSYLDKASRK